ncbi:hypothetical protein EK21DRAFT_112157 [Setomelanomma holmii]|uniref:Uncharacterized protein n=1 Tax=Setomelanomma holmii TaxID=210430 RepID=A0A9P4H9Y4_9PLEO|nr:hypothetical protein EK21DRAFT_112157 [Setomelanomma holmii]
MAATDIKNPTLLALPGELRNRIYGMCRSPSAIISLHPNTDGRPYWETQGGQFLGLIQTCRQIRTECVSSLMRDITFKIPLEVADHFAYTFFVGMNLPKFVVDLSRTIDTWYPASPEQTLARPDAGVCTLDKNKFEAMNGILTWNAKTLAGPFGTSREY